MEDQYVKRSYEANISLEKEFTDLFENETERVLGAALLWDPSLKHITAREFVLLVMRLAAQLKVFGFVLERKENV